MIQIEIVLLLKLTFYEALYDNQTEIPSFSALLHLILNSDYWTELTKDYL